MPQGSIASISQSGQLVGFDRYEMISKDVLSRLRCMHSRTALREASLETVQAINQAIAVGSLTNGLGQVVVEPFEAGLVNDSSSYFYPIVNGVVQMLRDELIDLKTLPPGTLREKNLRERTKDHE